MFSWDFTFPIIWQFYLYHFHKCMYFRSFYCIRFLMVSLTFLSPSVLRLYHKISQPPPWCLAVGLCICFHQFLNKVSQMSFVLGSCLPVKHNIINCVRGGPSCHGPQFGLVRFWPLPQCLLPLYSCTSCRPKKLWVERIVAGVTYPTFHWKYFLVIGGGHFKFPYC